MELFNNKIKKYLAAEQEIIQKLNIDDINQLINYIYNAYLNDGNIYIFGNGGSANTASHFCADFNKNLYNGKKKFHFICLNDNVSVITAIANDISYDQIYSYQLKDNLQRNDLVIGISGSGNSLNIINAIEYAKQQNIFTIGITGFNGGKLKQKVDFNLNIPINNMAIVEDMHLILNHLISSILKETINE